MKDCYGRLKNIVGKEIESFAVVQMVEEYRRYWRPPKQVKLILLAESHRYTTDIDFQCRLDLSRFDLSSYPNNFVQFVYCLGYGEKELLVNTPTLNPGTKDYWKIFYSCLNDITSHGDFFPVQKTKTRNFLQRMNNKIGLLKKMQQEGIWLVDASIIGIDDKYKPIQDIYTKIIECCWNYYIGEVIAQSHPAHIVIIGSMVKDVLLSKVHQLVGDRYSTIPQPAAFLNAQQRINMLRECRAAFLSVGNRVV
ncbi:MAG: hypothetical protein NT010_12705 [Proteobacteria bacterium]|nr:hypothetical protein [Pseudomonadota bacterium]